MLESVRLASSSAGKCCFLSWKMSLLPHTYMHLHHTQPCTHSSTHTTARTHTHTHTTAQTHTPMHTQLHIHIDIHTYARYTHLHTHLYAPTPHTTTHKYQCTHNCTYTSIYTPMPDIHTYTHVYNHIPMNSIAVEQLTMFRVHNTAVTYLGTPCRTRSKKIQHCLVISFIFIHQVAAVGS